MKKTILFLLAAFFAVNQLSAQQGEADDIAQYKRSSLYTIILDDHGLMNGSKAEIIKKTFAETPLPEKFNDHNLAIRTFNPKKYPVTKEEVEAVTGTQKKKGGLGGLAKSLGSSTTANLIDTTDLHKLPAIFIKFFEENNIANQLVGKWYDRKDEMNESANPPSFFDMELIKKRGLYNASEFDKLVAEKSARGVSMLADAGEELIKNTFVIGLRFNYVNKEELAKQVSSASSSITKMFGGTIAKAADLAVQAGTSIAGKGYVIKATAFLYQLEWNEETNNKFYSDYYAINDISQFDRSKDFKLKYIGMETEWADIQSTIFSKKSEEELVKRATIRSIDEVIAKLQKKYEAFRTKTPLLTTEPQITAQIGLKEGLEAGDKFEVLEKSIDEKTMKTTYKRVCVLKVDKKSIWDNRYAADEENEEKTSNGEAADENAGVKATVFTGSNKNIYPGMLIRQID